jgi:hypothetical protein
MSEKYVVDKNKNLVEGLSKEETYDLLAEAIKNGTLPGINTDNAFITQVKDSVTGYSHKVAFVTQAKYNELKNAGSLISNCLYYIVDDSTEEDIENAINQAKEEAIASANATTAEGLAKKLDKGEWVEYLFSYVKDTMVGVEISPLNPGTYIAEIVRKETRDNSHPYIFSLGVFTFSGTAEAYVGGTVLYGGIIYDLSAAFNMNRAYIKGNADLAGSSGSYDFYLRIRKIAND